MASPSSRKSKTKGPSQRSGKYRPRSRFAPEYPLLIQRLVDARKEAEMTQVEIAAKLDRPQSHISMIENCEREISIVELAKWCAAIGIRLPDLLSSWENDVSQWQRSDFV